MMIPLFVLTRKKIVVTKLGWVFCFCDLFFHLTLKSVKKRNVKTIMFYFWNRIAFQFSHKQERLQVLWFVKFWSCKRKLSKQLGIGDINNIYVRACLKPGWVRCVFHFTFEWLWIFIRPNLSFSRPNFFHWNLGCFAQGRFQHEILRSLPLSRLTVERDRTFPTALMFQFLKRPTVDMIDCVNRFLFLDPMERRNNFSVMFFGDQSFWRRNVWRKNHARRFHVCILHETFTANKR